MKIGIWSDAHCSEKYPYSEEVDVELGEMEIPRVSSRLAACWNAIIGAYDVMREEKCDASVFCGDLFFSPHERKSEFKGGGALSITELVGTKHVLEYARNGLGTFFLEGNHDQSSRHPQFSAIEAIMDESTHENHNYGRIPQRTYHVWMPREDTLFIFMPYAKTAKFEMSLYTLMKKVVPKSILEKCTRRYLFCHQMIEGVQLASGHRVGRGEGVALSVLEKYQFARIFNGHVHQPFKGEYIVHVGSVLQHDFGDEGCRTGVTVLDTEENRVFRHDVPSPRFRTITVQAADDYGRLKDGLADLHERSADYVRLRILGGTRWDVFDLLNNMPGVVRVDDERKSTKNVRLKSASVGASVDRMVAEYVDRSKTKLSKRKLVVLGQEMARQAKGQ